VDEIRARNFYKEGDITHFGQRIEGFNIPRLWTEIQSSAEVVQRKQEVEKFNQANKYRKRGLSVIPTKFGINFTAKFMNQGGALVHVYTDGSVLVSHGGTEMGQGLHTKMIQVAAQCLGIPDTNVIIEETSTQAVSNSMPTAASASTDLYGMAVLDACEQILARLRPIREKLPSDAKWADVVTTAFFERINLTAQGFYIIHTDRCGFNWDAPHHVSYPGPTAEFCPFNYFTQGVAVVEAEIDCLTGNHSIPRADILMDVGKSINPVLDIGQIEGAFMQGYGWSTMEELMWGDSQHPWVRPGQLFTRGPGTYKIPAFNDVPTDFRVRLSDTDNKFAVHSSKAVGEPPFFMGAAAYFAINNAVDAARDENKDPAFFTMDLPATSERIRMACGDNIASRLCMQTGVEDASYRPKGSW